MTLTSATNSRSCPPPHHETPSFRLLLLTLAAGAAQAQTKLATVDLQRAFNEYYKTKDAEASLQDDSAKIKKEQDSMVADYQKMLDNAQKLRDDAQDKTLTDQARAEKQKALEAAGQDLANKQRSIQEFTNLRSKEFEEKSRRMRNLVLADVTKLVNDVGQRDKYSLIIDKSGMSMNGTSVVLYAGDVKDITDDLIKELNANKPASSSAASPASAPAPVPSPAPAPAASSGRAA